MSEFDIDFDGIIRDAEEKYHGEIGQVTIACMEEAIRADREGRDSETVWLLEDMKDIIAHALQGDKIGGTHVQAIFTTAVLWSIFNRVSEALSTSKTEG